MSRTGKPSLPILWIVGIIMVAVILVTSLAIAYRLSTTSNVLNPGFEGAKVACYGVAFTSGYTMGLNTVYATGTMPYSPNNPLAYSLGGDGPNGYSNEVYWGSGTESQGSAQTIVQNQWERVYSVIPVTWNTVIDQQMLETRVESNIQLQGLNAQGYLTGTNTLGQTVASNGVPTLPALGTSNSAVQEIQIWNVQPIVANGIVTGYNMTKQDIILAQADFYIDVYVVPSQTNHDNHASGWEEGTFSGVELWYKLDWYQFGNSLGQVIANDPTAANNLAMLNAQYTGINATEGTPAFVIGGGVPITAWIQQATIPVQTSSGVVYDLISLASSKDTTPLAIDSVNGMQSGTRNTIMAMKNSLSPTNVGNYLDLYSSASDILSSTNANLSPNNAAQYVFDASTEYSPQYFKIAVQGFGAVAQSSGFTLSPDWTVYYPSISFLVHTVWAIYGTHTYLWTVQSASQNNYTGYIPQTTSSVFTPGAFNGIGGIFAGLAAFLTNPFGFLITLAIIAVIIVIILAATGTLPAVVSLFGMRKTSTRATVVRGQGHK